jgi:hypothetical protein
MIAVGGLDEDRGRRAGGGGENRKRRPSHNFRFEALIGSWPDSGGPSASPRGGLLSGWLVNEVQKRTCRAEFGEHRDHYDRQDLYERIKLRSLFRFFGYGPS